MLKIDAKQQSRWRRLVTLLRRTGKTVIALLLFYVAAILIGLIPVNNNFAPTTDGIEIFLVSNAVHSDIVMPIETEAIDWREWLDVDDFPGDSRGATHVAIGWGDRGFFLKTRTWDDLTATTTANALLWPSTTCLHVVYLREADLSKSYRSVRISGEQYASLVDFVKASFRFGDQGRPLAIANEAYMWCDGFYEAHGSYHCFNTCNCWVADALEATGVRVPWFAPMPKTVFLYLP